jgi:hypothetical protein
VQEKLNDFLGIAAMQRELHSRMLGQECADEPRQNVLRDCGRHSMGKFPGRLTCSCGKLLFRFRDDLQNPLLVTQQNHSLRRQRNASSGSIEEPDSEIVFEGLDLSVTAGSVRNNCSAALRKLRRSATDRKTFSLKFSS